MSSDPVVEPGPLSPDGLWRWDGAQWVPVVPSPAPLPPTRRSQRWIWWVVGGCAVLLVLGAVGAGFGIYGLVTRFQSGAYSCLPPDFPSYPHVSVVSENTKVGSNLNPGDTTKCTMVLKSNDNIDAVYSFYTQQMAAGDWTIVGSFPPNDGFQFRRTSRPQTIGSINLDPVGQGTKIQIDFNS